MAESVKRGEVFWYDFTYQRKGKEERGKRPCIVVSNDVCNQYSPVVTVVPCTTAIKKKHLPTHVRVITGVRVSTALCESLCTVDRSRLEGYICTVTEKEMNSIEDCIKVQLGLKGE